MKLIENVFQEFKEEIKLHTPVICEYINTPEGPIRLQSPILSTDWKCEWCSGGEHYTPAMNDGTRAKSWLCANTNCLVYEATRLHKTNKPIPKASRALEWPLFCEINHLGNLYHSVKFESLNQSEGKIKFLVDFNKCPRGIILMQGDPGTGKTYSALALLELFTRTNRSAIFTSQRKMLSDWLATFKAERYDPYIEKITNSCLLVIDDFGIAELSPAFMSFFMELLNTRLQWDNRGTVITTNLDDRKFSEYCGEALSDRILTGQKFVYQGKSLRKPIF